MFYSGSSNLRYRIALSLLLMKRITIKDIRKDSINPGITQYEHAFLQLIERLTTSSLFEINKTGTVLKFTPGIITNNSAIPFEFDCGNKAISYFIIGIIPIAIFGKEPLEVRFTGATHTNSDMSIESLQKYISAISQ